MSSSVNRASKKRRNGPIAQDALLSFALPSSSAERPSTSRRFTSLPKVAATMRPVEDAASTTSGSGLFHDEFGWIPASMPVPTAAIGCALVKISASGPMPTSRYWLHAFCSIRTCFRCAASADPGFSRARSSPTSRFTSARIAAAAFRSPRARSSITRSIIDATKVTPAALIACRSIGASSQGLPWSRSSGGVLASTSSSLPMRSPVAARRRSAGVPDSHRSRMVGKLADISRRSPSRTATTDGPPASGRHTRPASAACALSSGSTGCNASRNAVMRVLPNPGPAPYTMHNHEPRRQAHAAVRLVARSGDRDVSRHAHRRGVAREAVARAIQGAAQAWHRTRRHQSR